MANREVRLREQELAERVVSEPTIAPKVSHYADPAFELILKRSSSSRSRRATVPRLSGRHRPDLDQGAAGNLLRKFKEQTNDENIDS